jgi:hypothetical protein
MALDANLASSIGHFAHRFAIAAIRPHFTRLHFVRNVQTEQERLITVIAKSGVRR